MGFNFDFYQDSVGLVGGGNVSNNRAREYQASAWLAWCSRARLHSVFQQQELSVIHTLG